MCDMTTYYDRVIFGTSLTLNVSKKLIMYSLSIETISRNLSKGCDSFVYSKSHDDVINSVNRLLCISYTYFLNLTQMNTIYFNNVNV